MFTIMDETTLKLSRSPEFRPTASDDIDNIGLAKNMGEVAGLELIEVYALTHKPTYLQYVADLCNQEPPLSSLQTAYFVAGALDVYTRRLARAGVSL